MLSPLVVSVNSKLSSIEGVDCSASNSFVPGTKVVMADGSSKPIEEVELGDYVLATDPETGQTVSRKVVATVTGEGKRGWSRSPSTSMVRLVRRQR